MTPLVWIALLLGAIVWLIRVGSAVTLDRPFLGGTSGCEEEALFSVWKAANGHEIYNNPWLPPFSASYFGWLFYEVYGMCAKAGLAITGLNDAWLPTFTRFFTLLGLIVCVGIYYRLLRAGTNEAGRLSRVLLIGLSGIVFKNPLFHWWSFTTRADVWALFWELAALLAAFHYAQNGKLKYVVFVGIFAFLAWSFRQTNISVLAGFGLWLLLGGRWKVLFVMVVAMAFAFAFTMGLLGMNFIDSAFTANALSGDMMLSIAVANALSALTKDPLFTVGLVAAALLLWKSGRWWSNETPRLAFLASAMALVLGAVFSAKAGASSNYYLPPAALVPLFALVAASRGGFSPVLCSGFVAAGAAGMALASGLVLFGVSGNLRVPGDASLHETRAMREELREPIFSTDRGMNLPWILGSGADSYVFGFAYQRMLAARPEMFVDGTIADKFRQGYFRTVVVTKANASYVPTQVELADFRNAGGVVVER